MQSSTMAAHSPIVQLTPFYLPRVGGVERHVAALSAVLARKKVVTVIITQQHDASLPEYEQQGAVTIYRIPFSIFKLSTQSSLGAKLRYKARLWQWLLAHTTLLQQAKVIQVHDVGWWLAPFLYRKEVRRKLSLTFHGWEGQFPVRWQAKMQRFLLAQAAAVTVHVGAWIQEFYWDKPTLVLYGGSDFSQMMQLPEQKKSYLKKSYPISQKAAKKSSALQLCFLGRLEQENDLEEYLTCLQQLPEMVNKKKFSMIWVGDGKLRQSCERVGSVTGWVDDPMPFLATADIVFASSYLAMLEAQAAGKVVAAVYTHRLKQRYLETYPGLESIVLAKSGAALAEQVMVLLENRQKLAQLQKSSKAFAQQQTWEKIAARYQALWQKM